MYIQKTYTTGNVIEIEQYYRHDELDQQRHRRSRSNTTSSAQTKVNYRHAVNNLRRIINTNFDSSSLFVTLTYRNKHTDTVKAQTDIRNFLRKVKRTSSYTKYVYSLELGKSNIHCHIVLACGLGATVVRRCWNYGNVNIKHLDSSGNYGSIASYMLKETKEHKQFSKMYYSSKNLSRPEPVVTIINETDIMEKPTAPSGYMVLTDTVYSSKGKQEYSGELWERQYQYYQCIKTEAPAWSKP